MEEKATQPTRDGVRVLLPKSPTQASDWAGKYQAPFLAAGTWLQPQWEKAGRWPAAVVSLHRIKALSAWELSADAVDVGALTPLQRLCEDAALGGTLPMLTDAVRAIAAPGVRNLGSVGGNLVAGGDLVPVLLALNADLTCMVDGRLASMSLADWLVLDRKDSLICQVHVPQLSGTGWHWFTEKIGHREAFSPPLLSVAGCVSVRNGCIADIRLAVGGSVKARRLPRSENVLVGRPPSHHVCERLREVLRSELDGLGDSYLATTAAELFALRLQPGVFAGE